MTKLRSSPFGSTSRTRALVALSLLGESHARELPPVLGVSLTAVQRALRSLERDGLVAARSVGRTRVYSLDPRYFARKELRAFLATLAGADREMQSIVSGLRRRPRRTGKPG